jgi:hypothetical protein
MMMNSESEHVNLLSKLGHLICDIGKYAYKEYVLALSEEDSKDLQIIIYNGYTPPQHYGERALIIPYWQSMSFSEFLDKEIWKQIKYYNGIRLLWFFEETVCKKVK